MDGFFALQLVLQVSSNDKGVTPLRLNGPWIEAASLLPAKRHELREDGMAPRWEVKSLC